MSCDRESGPDTKRQALTKKGRPGEIQAQNLLERLNGGREKWGDSIFGHITRA